MTELEKRLVSTTLQTAKNMDRNGVFIGDAIRLKLYWTIVETCLDRDDREEIIAMMRDDRESVKSE